MKKLDQVIVGQIAQDPLNPDHIIFMLELKLLQTDLVEAKIVSVITSYFSTLGDSTYSRALSN